MIKRLIDEIPKYDSESDIRLRIQNGKLHSTEYALLYHCDMDKSDIIECGTAEGASFIRMKQILDLKQGSLSHNDLIGYLNEKTETAKVFQTCYRLFTLDSGYGLPEDWLDSNGNLVGQGRRGRFTMNGKYVMVGGVTHLQGWFKDTIPLWCETFGKVCKNGLRLLHVDCDLYSSTKDVLYGLNEFIKPGTIIVFDEWFYLHSAKYDDHEARAALEWKKDKNREWEEIPYIDPFELEKMKHHGWTDFEKKIVRILK